jgi:glycosidase
MIGKVSPYPLVKRLVGASYQLRIDLDTSEPHEVIMVNRETGEEKQLIFINPQYQLEITPDNTGIEHFMFKARKGRQNKWEFITNEDLTKYELQVQVNPAWVGKKIFYSVFVRFFKGKIKAEVQRDPGVEKLQGISSEELRHKSIDPTESILPGEGGTFDDVKFHLDTLKSMGIGALYFNPIHMIGEIYRGYNMLDQLPSYLQPGSPYSIKDYKSIDPELTYDKDSNKHWLSDPGKEFKELVDAAHERGMYIIMDLVFNHTAHDFVFQRIRPEWYLYKEDITNTEEPYLYPADVKQGKPWGDPKHSVPPYDHGVFWHDCAQLNWEYKLTPASNQPPPNSSLHEMWDYLKSVPKFWIEHFGIDGFRCDVAYRVPPEFWQECIFEAREFARLKQTNLSKDVVFIGESYTNDLAELQACGFAAVYGDFSHKLSSPLSLKGYLDYIYNISSQDYPEGSLWLHFPDSHDFDRSPRKVLGDRAGDKDKAKLANQSRWVLTASLPGVPLLFNGFEKVEWQPINIWSYGAINWEGEADLRDYIAKVNNIRNTHLALQKGSYQFLETSQGLDQQTQLLCYLRELNEELVIVAVNMDVDNSIKSEVIELPVRFEKEQYILRDLLTDQEYSRRGRELAISLEPGQSHIFEVEFMG